MKNTIRITGGYMGRGQITAEIAGKEYVMDVDEVEKLLLRLVKDKGYTTAKTSRQKYTRLIINT